jgi:mono/diheme cytochrome c family protein
MAAPASAQNHPSPSDPVVDPSAPMTIAQVRRGEELYAGKCANCHGAKLEGKTSTPLTGPVFAGKWAEQTAKDLYARVRTMPYGAANSLSQTQYLDLTAFILAKNGAATGAGDLPAAPAALAKVKVIAAGGAATAKADTGPVSKTTTIRPIGDIIGSGPTQEELSAAEPAGQGRVI